MVFACLFIFATMQLLRLGCPINDMHQHFLDRLPLGGRPCIGLLPATPPTSNRPRSPCRARSQ
ncbi:hypothetical protein FA95DRAFT_1567649 [Auriscalpium vulgare]|uniref:Uncharacterized protein n=1 Tax=Auriscalpium vulgare TaxID=40419 RepID=A0ACB8R3E0_9AGAM|nr:hypothetical protein FA95DRAFT_1567649 [Auriscalpium vulgare]